MLWLIYCVLFVFMLVGIVRMLNQRGKWAWRLFLGLLGSVLAYVLLFILPVASSVALQNKPTLLAAIIVGGTAGYIGLLIYSIRRVAAKLKAQTPPP